MRSLVYFVMTIIVIAAYFSAMYLTTTITVEGLEDTYHFGNEIKFTAKVQGFGDAVPAYNIVFQNQANLGIQMGAVGSISGIDTTYLNFPIPFEKTINYSYTPNIYNDKSGAYVMKLNTLGHAVEKKIKLLP